MYGYGYRYNSGLVVSAGGAPLDTTFKMTVDTTKAGSASNTFVLKLHTGVTNMNVYWGDGNSDLITVYNQAQLTHVYSSSGTYQLTLDGSFAGLYQGLDRLKVMSIDNWGVNVWSNVWVSFAGCTNMVANYTDNPDFSGAGLMNYSFLSCVNFNGALEIDVSTSFTMYQMFTACSSLNKPITFLNSSSVGNMQYMFYGCTVFNQDVSSLDITSLTTATGMFQNSAFATINYDKLLVAWDSFGTSNVPFHAGTAKYSSGAPATARANMVSRGWTIIDGGAV